MDVMKGEDAVIRNRCGGGTLNVGKPECGESSRNE